MGLNDTISEFSTGTYQVSRAVSGAYVDGVLQPNVPTVFQVVASIVPGKITASSGGNELVSESEGQRQKSIRTLFTVTELLTRDTGFAADTVEVGGDPYTVISVQFWEGSPEDSTYECKISRQVKP